MSLSRRPHHENRASHFESTTGKRFREFINAGAYIDVKPNDDIVDILGFLAYEVVRELCIKAVAIRDAEEERNRLARSQPSSRRKAAANAAAANTAASGTDSADTSQESIDKPAPGGAAGPPAAVELESTPRSDRLGVSARKRKMTLESGGDRIHKTPTKRQHLMHNGDSPSVGGSGAPDTPAVDRNEKEDSPEASTLDGELCSLFTMPPSKHVPLTPAHIQEAFARVQRGNAALVSGGVPSQPGGLRRTRLFVI